MGVRGKSLKCFDFPFAREQRSRVNLKALHPLGLSVSLRFDKYCFFIEGGFGSRQFKSGAERARDSRPPPLSLLSLILEPSSKLMANFLERVTVVSVQVLLHKNLRNNAACRVNFAEIS